MAGEKGKRREPNALYQAACGDLADQLGFKPSDIWFWFCQLSWCYELEQKWPRGVAEYVAHQHVKSIFDKRGEAPS